jgi:hypothetical protein
MPVSYLTAIKKVSRRSSNCVIIWHTYIVAIPDIRTGVLVVHWVCLNLYQEGNNSSYSVWEATSVSFHTPSLFSYPITKQEIYTMKQTVKTTFTG